MIIVEGADHLGKTTFVNKIATHFNLAPGHLGIPPEGWDFRGDYVNLIREQRVYDRFHLGAIVYGSILRCHPVPSDLNINIAMVDNTLRHANAVMIILHASDENWYRERLESGKEEAFDEETILAANRIFPWIAPSWARIIDVSKGYPEVEQWMKPVG